MSSQIVNASAGSCFYTVGAVAIDSTTQPDVTAGRAIGLGSNRSLLNNISLGATENSFQGSRIYSTKGTGVFSAKRGDAITGATVAADGGKSKFTKAGHTVAVGDSLYVTDTNGVLTGIHKVLVITSTTIKTQFPYTSGAGTLVLYPVSGTLAFGTGVGNRFSILRKVNTTVNNVSNTAMLSGGAPDNYRKSPKNLMGARAQGVALAIRSGYWNEYSGSWSTSPTATNTSLGNVAGSTLTDTSTDNAVTSRSVAAELCYLQGSVVPYTKDYDLPTC